LLDAVSERPEVIVCNLPFIPTERIAFLDKKNNNEPPLFFDGGEDGFMLYRKLFQQMIQKNLYPSMLIAEIDYSQSFLAVKEAQKYFPRCQVNIHTDQKHKIRILTIIF
jgi:release factor glutamine methyltransferase